jgi:hypothetical protein
MGSTAPARQSRPETAAWQQRLRNFRLQQLTYPVEGARVVTMAFSKISIGDAATVLQLLRNLQPANSAAGFAAWCARAAEGLTEHGNRLLLQTRRSSK